MTPRPKRLLWPWIAALLIGLPVLYVASFGPACWLAKSDRLPVRPTAWLYKPLIAATFYGPRPVRRTLRKYVERFTGSAIPVIVSLHQDGIYFGILEKLRDAK